MTMILIGSAVAVTLGVVVAVIRRSRRRRRYNPSDVYPLW